MAIFLKVKPYVTINSCGAESRLHLVERVFVACRHRWWRVRRAQPFQQVVGGSTATRPKPLLRWPRRSRSRRRGCSHIICRESRRTLLPCLLRVRSTCGWRRWWRRWWRRCCRWRCRLVCATVPLLLRGTRRTCCGQRRTKRCRRRRSCNATSRCAFPPWLGCTRASSMRRRQWQRQRRRRRRGHPRRSRRRRRGCTQIICRESRRTLLSCLLRVRSTCGCRRWWRRCPRCATPPLPLAARRHSLGVAAVVVVVLGMHTPDFEQSRSQRFHNVVGAVVELLELDVAKVSTKLRQDEAFCCRAFASPQNSGHLQVTVLCPCCTLGVAFAQPVVGVFEDDDLVAAVVAHSIHAQHAMPGLRVV